MTFNRFYIFILLLLLTIAGKAENLSWTLKECIQHALQNNLDHYQYQLGVESSAIESRQARLNLLPTFSASSSAGISYGRTVDPSSNGYVNTDYFSSSVGLGASLTVFRGFILQNQIGYEKYLSEASEWEQINNADELAFKVMIAYYDLIYYDGLEAIALEQLELSEFNLHKTEKQIETGLKAKADLAEMSATFEKEKLYQLQARNNAEEARLKLSQYLNLGEGQSVAVPETETDFDLVMSHQPAADSLYQAFVLQSPYVKIAEAKLNAAEKQLAIARGRYFPALSFNASIGTNYSETSVDDDDKVIPVRTQFKNNMGKYVGASLSIPIFTKNAVRSNVRLARLQEEQAETELKAYKQQLYYELANNTRELQALFQQLSQTSKQFEAEDLAFRIAQRKYDQGILNAIDLLTVKQRLAEVKAALLSARLQFTIKDRVIDFYLGTRFWEEE